MRPSLFAATLGAILAAGLLTSCGERPQRHPASILADRYQPRMGLIELVVKDQARQKRVLKIHEDLEDLALHWQSRRAQYLEMLLTYGQDGEVLPEEQLVALYDEAEAETAQTFEQYVDLQMALRENVTADEFARLDGIR